MAKQAVVIPPRPDQRGPAPPRPHMVFTIGRQRYKMEINARITPLPDHAAEAVPIDRKRACRNTPRLAARDETLN